MKIKPLYSDGIVYNKQYIEELKQPLLDVRDVLLEQGQLPYALSLSEIHALLCYLAENTD